MTVLAAGSATDVGNVRTNNQDQLLVASPLFAVADGMGGHAAGEVASLTAIEALRVAFDRNPVLGGLVAAAETANRSVWDRAQADTELWGMGTTLVAVALVSAGPEQPGGGPEQPDGGGDQLEIINVGDSRVYLLRQGELEQLTTDHSLVQELVDDGQLSEAEAEVHPQRHVLTRALGVDPEVEIDHLEVIPVKGDRYLLCSDGLPREVSDSQIASVLRRLADPQEAAKELVNEARAHGGNDNITVVIIDVVDDDDKAAAASAALAAEPGLVIPSEVGKGDRSGDGSTSAADASGRTGRGDRHRLSRWAGPAVADNPPRTRAMTGRAVGFVLSVAVLIAVAVAAVGWYARGSYFVGVDRDQLTIFKGRPGGLLWFKPTVVERTGIRTTQVLPSRLDDLQSGKEEASVGGARQYLQNLQTEAAAHGIGTSTSIAATTTTLAPSGSSTSTPASSTTVP